MDAEFQKELKEEARESYRKLAELFKAYICHVTSHEGIDFLDFGEESEYLSLDQMEEIRKMFE